MPGGPGVQLPYHQLLNARIKIGQAGSAQGPEQEKLYRQAQTTLEEVLSRPLTVEDEEPLSELDLERQAHAMLAEVHHRQQRNDKARHAIDKALGIVASMTAYFPQDMKQLYCGKPEIKALQSLKDIIAEGP